MSVKAEIKLDWTRSGRGLHPVNLLGASVTETVVDLAGDLDDRACAALLRGVADVLDPPRVRRAVADEYVEEMGS